MKEGKEQKKCVGHSQKAGGSEKWNNYGLKPLPSKADCSGKTPDPMADRHSLPYLLPEVFPSGR